MFLCRCQGAIYLLCYIVAILFIQSISFSAILFEDNFEDGIIGKEPKKWQYDPDAEVNNIGKIDVDPTNPANKVFTGFGGYLADNGRIFKDFVLEFDWMFMKDDQNNSIGFRVVDNKTAHYQLSRRSGSVDWKIYRYDGEWADIGGKDWPTELETWYSVQLICEGSSFTVKGKRKDDPTPFKDIKKSIIKTKDDAHKEGFISTSYWGPIDNVIIAESENDILDVDPSAKISTTWARIKNQSR